MNLSLSAGDSEENVRRNRELFFGSLGIGPEEIAVPRQVHGDRVAVVRRPGSAADTDGLITSAERVFLCVTIADCVPILLADPENRAVAAVHAGWRGTASGIAAAAVRLMADACGSHPNTLRAFVGPSASVCCYEVGEDVAGKFSAQFVDRRTSSVRVDLKGANRAQLTGAGLDPENIEISPYCTISETSIFHSHRREGSASGRMMAVIGIIS
jgi:YfiH family protein